MAKGSVQTVSPLPDAGALRLTTARYYRPNGTPVDCVGVSPDLEIKTPAAPGHAEEPHQDPGTCADLSVPPPRPSPLRMADFCPDVTEPAAGAPATGTQADTGTPAATGDAGAAGTEAKETPPETGAKGAEAKAGPDLPLRCAVSALQARRVVNQP